MLYGQPADISASRYMSITRPAEVEISRSGRSPSSVMVGHSVHFTNVIESCGLNHDALSYEEASSTLHHDAVDREVGMITDSELLRRERNLKTAINGTGVMLLAAAIGSLFGFVSVLALDARGDICHRSDRLMRHSVKQD